MQLLRDEVIPRNSGKAFTVKRGQRIRIIGKTTVDFVAFNLNDLTERFDQGRTKSNEGKIFVSTGDRLWTKRNNVILTITEDGFREGHHDLQKGTCSRRFFELVLEGKAKRERQGEEYLSNVREEDVPDHGCWENLSNSVKEWGIAPEDIPSPFNIFQHMKIDADTGRMWHTNIRPSSETFVEMRAEMDCLIAASACPELNRGGPIRVQIYR